MTSALTIEGFSEGHLLKQVQKIVERKTGETQLFDRSAEERIPKFDASELSLGRVLGKGGFSHVHEVTKVAVRSGGPSKPPTGVQDHHDQSTSHHLVQDRDFMQACYIRKGRDYRYAVKKLRPDATKDASLFIQGICDLAIESKFLAVIRHPNVIKMRAAASVDPLTKEFFIVLDRLYGILTTTLVAWKSKEKSAARKLVGKKQKLRELWEERLTIAHDLAYALQYLHGLDIIYRDLKPDNVGFDVRGDVKIFDFGLARQLPAGNRTLDGTFKMTADTGSPIYMAPEVALERGYNQRADVYSFGILLHQICSLDEPFRGFTMKMISAKVYHGGARPRIDPSWPGALKDLMGKCMAADQRSRPSMKVVADTLRDELSGTAGGPGDDDVDASNKSMKSLRGFKD